MPRSIASHERPIAFLVLMTPEELPDRLSSSTTVTTRVRYYHV